MYEFTVSDVISAVDELEPNQYSTLLKLQWLTELDGQIYEEIIKTHEPDCWKSKMVPDGIHVWKGDPLDQGVRGGQYPVDGEDPDPAEDWKLPYTEETDHIIVGAPYGMNLYLNWLKAKIAYSNAEQSKYAIYSAAYNDAFNVFSAWYNRTHMPKREPGGNRYRF